MTARFFCDIFITMKQQYIKQVYSRGEALLYLHLIGEFCRRQLSENSGYLEGLDGSFAADNYDGVLIFSLSGAAKKILDFNNIPDFKIADIERAINRIECYTDLTLIWSSQEIAQKIKKIHHSSWMQTNISQVVNYENYFKKHSGLVKPINPHKIYTLNTFYELENLRPELKPLAVNFLAALSSINEISFYSSFTTPYLSDDSFFADYSDFKNLVGLQHIFKSSKKPTEKPEQIQEILKLSIQTVRQSGFSKKLLQSLKLGKMHANNTELMTGSGFIVTQDYWRNITIQDIESFFDALKIEAGYE